MEIGNSEKIEKKYEIYLAPIESIQFLGKVTKKAKLEKGKLGGEFDDFRYTNGLDPKVGLSDYSNVILIKKYDEFGKITYVEMLTNTFIPKSGEMQDIENPKFLLRDKIYSPVMVHEKIGIWTRISSASALRQELAKLSEGTDDTRTFTSAFLNAINSATLVYYEMQEKVDETVNWINSCMKNCSKEGEILKRIVDKQ